MQSLFYLSTIYYLSAGNVLEMKMKNAAIAMHLIAYSVQNYLQHYYIICTKIYNLYFAAYIVAILYSIFPLWSDIQYKEALPDILGNEMSFS